ncbi:MAG: hypothetical protein ACK55I_47170, partial [bacterium]
MAAAALPVPRRPAAGGPHGRRPALRRRQRRAGRRIRLGLSRGLGSGRRPVAEAGDGGRDRCR